jgi:iron complex transport system substrate-binding protein
MQARISSIIEKTSLLSYRPGVFYLTWHDPLKTSGTGTLHHELIEKAGGDNLFADISGTKSVDLELVLARNPQIMIAGTSMGSGADNTLTYLKTEARLQGTDAARSVHIYSVNIDLSGRAGPRIVDGLEQFARCIHPEIFGSP